MSTKTSAKPSAAFKSPASSKPLPTDNKVGANKLADTVAAVQKAGGAPETKDDAAGSKKQAMDEAVNRFQEISKKLGGASQAQAFFATYGTDGFKPEAEEKPEAIVPKEMTLDSDIKDREGKGLGLPTRPEGSGASYIKEDPWAVEDINEAKVATQLEEEEWAELLDTTKMLHGFVISNAPGRAGTMSRARFPAFALKPLPGKALAEALTSKPHFEVFDNSSISVKETKTQLEKSMAQNGFSSAAIEASVGASTPTIGASVSASHKQESEQSKNRGDFEDRQEYTATYNFPRARVFVDELNLQVTPECATYLSRLREANRKIHANVENGDKPDKDNAVEQANALVRQFFQRFGHIFATTFQLGGQLTATKSAESIASTSETSKRDAMQQAAAVSVGFKVFSASTSVSRGSSQEDKAAAAALANNSALAWSARGGNTLLCANPPEWANSVANYESWRVIEQENVEVLYDLIGKLTSVNDDTLAEWKDIPTIFNDIAQREFQVQPDIPEGTWTGKITLETLDGRKVILDKGQLCLSSDTNASHAVLQVLDADIRRSTEVTPAMAELYADHPLFIIDNTKHARSVELGNQIPGLWVDTAAGNADGSIKSKSSTDRKICRWSMRKGSPVFGQALTPDKIKISHGDEVTLSCHSYHSGGTFTDPTSPPFYSPCIARKDNELKVFKLDEAFLKNMMSQELCDKLASVGFLRNGTNDVPLQKLIEQSDVGRLSGSGASQLEFYRKFLATKDLLNNVTEDLKAMVAPLETTDWWTSDPVRTARIMLEKPITSQTKTVDVWTFLVEREVRVWLEKWAKETGFGTDPVVFKVKFVN